jgi:diacylglycerol kinase
MTLPQEDELESPPVKPPRRHTLIQRFRWAFRGAWLAIRQEANFRIHLVVALAVVSAAVLLRCEWLEWAVLGLCMGLVLTAEMLNSAIERLARAVTRRENPNIRDALDMAAGGVLVAAVAASAVGALVLGWRLVDLLKVGG